MHFCAARLNFFDEFEKIFIEMIDGFPFGFGGACRAACQSWNAALVLSRTTSYLPKRGLDDLAMPQIVREIADACSLELLRRTLFMICASTSAR